MNTEIINKLKNFVYLINEKDRIAILYHTDADGICSAVITAKAIERINNKKVDLILNQEFNEIEIKKGTVEKLKN